MAQALERRTLRKCRNQLRKAADLITKRHQGIPDPVEALANQRHLMTEAIESLTQEIKIDVCPRYHETENAETGCGCPVAE